MRDTDGVIDPFATYTSISEMALRMFLAVLLGAVPGFERKYRNRPAGLTTGASLWLTGAVGLACGIGYYVVAGLATILALFILVFVRVIERVIPTDDTQPVRTDKHAEAHGKTGETSAEA